MTPSPKLNEAFYEWFGDSHVVDRTFAPLVVYHGTARADRVGTRFRKTRATSGPMAFFTDSYEVASKYATGKQDTSLAAEWPVDYADWFFMKVGRRKVNLRQAWHVLPAEVRAHVLQRIVPVCEASEVCGKDHVLYELRRAHGNALEALKEIFLSSGYLFDNEAAFLNVLNQVGVTGFQMYSPWHREEKVYAVFLRIEHPLYTDEITPDVFVALDKASKRVRRRAAVSGADMWDKNTRDARAWMKQLVEDYNVGKNSMVWTSIPDWVTKTLVTLGYDGICDTGGKQGGEGHNVWIPFDDHQVKSVENRGTWSRKSANIMNPHRSAK